MQFTNNLNHTVSMVLQIRLIFTYILPPAYSSYLILSESSICTFLDTHSKLSFKQIQNGILAPLIFSTWFGTYPSCSRRITEEVWSLDGWILVAALQLRTDRTEFFQRSKNSITKTLAPLSNLRQTTLKPLFSMPKWPTTSPTGPNLIETKRKATNENATAFLYSTKTIPKKTLINAWRSGDRAEPRKRVETKTSWPKQFRAPTMCSEELPARIFPETCIYVTTVFRTFIF